MSKDPQILAGAYGRISSSGRSLPSFFNYITPPAAKRGGFEDIRRLSFFDPPQLKKKKKKKYSPNVSWSQSCHRSANPFFCRRRIVALIRVRDDASLSRETRGWLCFSICRNFFEIQFNSLLAQSSERRDSRNISHTHLTAMIRLVRSNQSKTDQTEMRWKGGLYYCGFNRSRFCFHLV